MTDFPLRDDFDAITVVDKSVLNRASWKDETGSAFDAFEYMTRCRSVPLLPKDGRVRRNSDITSQRAQQEGRRPSGLKPSTPERGSDTRRKRMGGTPKLGQTELVEERILEDGPTRTISMWREQVATDTAKERVPPIHIPGPTNGKRHRRTQSDANGQTTGIPVSTRLMDGREIINRARNMSIEMSSVRDRLPLCSCEAHIFVARSELSSEAIVQCAVKRSPRADFPTIAQKDTTNFARWWFVQGTFSGSLSKASEGSSYRRREFIGDQLWGLDPRVIVGFVSTVVITFDRTFARVGDPARGASQSPREDARGYERPGGEGGSPEEGGYRRRMGDILREAQNFILVR